MIFARAINTVSKALNWVKFPASLSATIAATIAMYYSGSHASDTPFSAWSSIRLDTTIGALVMGLALLALNSKRSLATKILSVGLLGLSSFSVVKHLSNSNAGMGNTFSLVFAFFGVALFFESSTEGSPELPRDSKGPAKNIWIGLLAAFPAGIGIVMGIPFSKRLDPLKKGFRFTLFFPSRLRSRFRA
jgi:hypothetical protein